MSQILTAAISNVLERQKVVNYIICSIAELEKKETYRRDTENRIPLSTFTEKHQNEVVNVAQTQYIFQEVLT